jgi:hypothetical protein
MQYVAIHGLAPHHLMGNGDQSDTLLREYIAGIVYGSPTRIFAILLATGRFVALVEYDGETVWASGTFERMGSFSYGATLSADAASAFSEFGSWAAHYSGSLNREEVA